VTRYQWLLMVEQKYHLPTWLQAMWWLIFTCTYNKAKAGMWFPGAKKRAPKEGD
jgi:hypothetical protein